MIGNDLVFFAFPDAGHQQKTSLNSGAAKRHRLFGTRHSKPGSVFGLKRSRAGGGAVAVGVRLDHGADADAFADMLPHGAEVLAEGVERNFRPSWAGDGGEAIKERRVHSADYIECRRARRYAGVGRGTPDMLISDKKNGGQKCPPDTAVNSLRARSSP